MKLFDTRSIGLRLVQCLQHVSGGHLVFAGYSGSMAAKFRIDVMHTSHWDKRSCDGHGKNAVFWFTERIESWIKCQASR